MSETPPTSRSRQTLPPPVSTSIWYRPDRPKIVGMAGWFCVTIGYIGFILKGSQLPALFFPEKMKAINPQFTPMPYSREQFAIAALFLLAGMAISLLCIAGALGTLRMRQWGRKAILWYAILGALVTLAKTAWQIKMFDFMIDYQIKTSTQPIDRASIENPAFFALIVMTGIQLLWFAGLIVLMTNRWIVSVFEDPSRSLQADTDWQSSR